jgi:hypothetical protein
MRILLINNDGGGFADYVEVEPGTTVATLFGQRMPDCQPQDYLIRVNRQHAAADQVLQEQDRVSITPTKIQGAAHARPAPASPAAAALPTPGPVMAHPGVSRKQG